MTTWFTADTHFGHRNIIKYCGRPFADVTEMDGAMIGAWNSVVQPCDDIWHLGDFAFRNATATASYLARLSGRKHLVWGNHDSPETRELAGWATSAQMAEITVSGVRLVLLHYAMKVWPRSHQGSIHLFGHSHGTLPADSQSCDVGVDAWSYRPVTLQEIQRALLSQPARQAPDRHGT